MDFWFSFDWIARIWEQVVCFIKWPHALETIVLSIFIVLWGAALFRLFYKAIIRDEW